MAPSREGFSHLDQVSGSSPYEGGETQLRGSDGLKPSSLKEIMSVKRLFGGFFLYSGSFSLELAQVIQFGAAHFAFAHRLNFGDSR